ncbi:MAG: SGNH/GDSL hydrolase family protein [Candidatus Lernaella stagnicola]|nr:SGNH/GDSL hydrolase family protein [Candidatus Lernaella stagnicola]
MSANRRRFSRTRRLVYSLVALAAAWLALEIVVAATGLYKRPSERVFTDVYDAAYELLPGVRVPFGNAPIPEDPTNHAGFRGPEFSDTKPEGVFRVICVGDSTTFGVMVPEPETYARRLEKSLHAKAPRVEVLNAGVPGTNIFAHRVLLAKTLLPLKPDVIVLYVLFNGRPEVEDIRRKIEGGRAANRVQLALRHSAVYRLLRRLLKGGFALDSDAPLAHLVADSGVPGGWVETSFRADLHAVVDQVQHAGAKLVLVYHLTRPGVQARLDRRANPALPLGASERFNRRLRGLTRDAAATRGVVFLDPMPAFVRGKSEDKQLFLDDVHFSSHGHAVLAEELTEPLGKLLGAP